MLKNRTTKMFFCQIMAFIVTVGLALFYGCTWKTAKSKEADRIQITEMKVGTPIRQEARQGSSAAPTESASLSDLKKKLLSPRWIAYAPTNYNPDPNNLQIPSDESIKADLEVLHKAGFDGLVTYGADLTMIPRIAKEVGFRGMLLGVWNPKNADELAKAKESAKNDIIVAIIVGNEGLTFNRYDLPTLKHAVEEMRQATGKPTTTTEVIEKYLSNKELLDLSDFLAVNAHPYHHSVKTPKAAVDWTVRSYENLSKYTDKFILFKEAGLPTAGDTGLSEEAQAEYYRLLRDTKVHFVYFEAFDAPWKQGGKTEPHWGLFHADRSEKPVIAMLTGSTTVAFVDVSQKFYPSGWMGDGEGKEGNKNIKVDNANQEKPHSPPTCYKWTYRPGGKGWAAVAWQYPEQNWGKTPGHNLTGYSKVTFWVRGQNGGEVLQFKALGHTELGAQHPASSFEVETEFITLTTNWTRHEIDLTGRDLSNVPCAFVWVARAIENPDGCTFYLDDIRYEK